LKLGHVKVVPFGSGTPSIFCFFWLFRMISLSETRLLAIAWLPLKQVTWCKQKPIIEDNKVLNPKLNAKNKTTSL
jgi:hypothetical protein